MRLSKYITEATGNGITFIDLDETIFSTFIKIRVIKDKKVVKTLTNVEFRSYKKKEGEEYDFGDYSSSKLFKETSVPIHKTIKRMKNMISKIKKSSKDSRIIILTARTFFDDKELFYSTFKDYGLDLRKDNIKVERNKEGSGNVKKMKSEVIRKYLKSGKYKRVRVIDDSIKNIKAFLELEKEFDGIQFFGLLVKENGTLKRIK